MAVHRRCGTAAAIDRCDGPGSAAHRYALRCARDMRARVSSALSAIDTCIFAIRSIPASRECVPDAVQLHSASKTRVTALMRCTADAGPPQQSIVATVPGLQRTANALRCARDTRARVSGALSAI